MLGKHLSGTDLIKAEHRRVLVTKLDGRTHQSVDFKHRNISSVLDELGMVWLDGYQPAANRQSLLVDEVLDVLGASPQLAKLQGIASPFVDASTTEIESRPIETAMRAIAARRGQSRFRKRLLHLYGNQCAVTGEGPTEVLEAAHIQPYSLAGLNTIDNGLLLRADIHTLFDLGLIAITPVVREVHVDKRLDGTSYFELDKELLRPRIDASVPSDVFLRQRVLINNIRNAELG